MTLCIFDSIQVGVLLGQLEGNVVFAVLRYPSGTESEMINALCICKYSRVWLTDESVDDEYKVDMVYSLLAAFWCLLKQCLFFITAQYGGQGSCWKHWSLAERYPVQPTKKRRPLYYQVLLVYFIVISQVTFRFHMFITMYFVCSFRCYILSPPSSELLKIDPFVYVERTLNSEAQNESDDEDEAAAATA